jgi:SAM-dependent methyltransferase
MLFDQDYYLAINEARWAVIAPILDRLSGLGLATAIDAGCGPGWFAKKLVERGLSVTGIDGREELTQAAAERVPSARFVTSDMEEAHRIGLEPADLVLCVGLLYHLENPYRVVRAVSALTGKICVVESRVIPGNEPLLGYSVEGSNETQGLTYQAVIPSLPVLAKMLYTAGFTGVWRYTGAVDHEDFRETPTMHSKRVVLVASKGPDLSGTGLEPMPEPPIWKFSFAKA